MRALTFCETQGTCTEGRSSQHRGAARWCPSAQVHQSMGTRIATVVVQSQAAAMLAWPRALLLDRPGVTLQSSS
jgi:hypothetical protein